jgi:uncharacterized protein (DUF924 family)
MQYRERAHAIVNYWFHGENLESPGKADYELWYSTEVAIDAEVKDKFEKDVELALAGEYDCWMEEPVEAMALIVLLSEFPTRIWRDARKGFDVAEKAIPYAYVAVGRHYDRMVHSTVRAFYYQPLMHSEFLRDLDICVELYKHHSMDYDFPKLHRDTVAKFGRFPSRNEALGRTNTADEEIYLNEPDETDSEIERQKEAAREAKKNFHYNDGLSDSDLGLNDRESDFDEEDFDDEDMSSSADGSDDDGKKEE